MARWYRVRLRGPEGSFYDIEASGNTKGSAERSARGKLRERIGEEHRKYFASRTTFIGKK